MQVKVGTIVAEFAKGEQAHTRFVDQHPPPPPPPPHRLTCNALTWAPAPRMYGDLLVLTNQSVSRIRQSLYIRRVCLQRPCHSEVDHEGWGRPAWPS